MGRYIDEILQPGEKVLYSTNAHWIFYLPAIAAWVVALAFLVASRFFITDTPMLLCLAAAGDHLQAAVMRLRRVPLGGLLRKAPRIARDVAGPAGKQIEVVIEGEDVAVDKARVEILDSALLHLVRNAADHGIEKPDERAAAGKPRQGIIRVSATLADGMLGLRIEDDGRGVDPVRVRAKVEKLGLLQPGQAVDEQAVIAFIFASGVSTAERVSEVSGRGVGLDAVKRAVEEAGGVIACDNRPGRGCAFILRIPVAVSTQIKPAYLFTVAGRAFGLPLDAVGETFRADAGAVSSVAGGGRCTLRHDHVLPVIELGPILASGTGVQDQVLVTVVTPTGAAALAVEAVLGVQQVVVRPIEGSVEVPPYVSGAALLGDGGVALLLDLPALLRTAGGG